MKVRVLVDPRQTQGNGKQIKIEKNRIKISVDTVDSFMTHDDSVVVDNSKIMQGSVNWFVHEMKSVGARSSALARITG